MGHANSPHPSSREGHLSTARWSSSFLLSGLILNRAAAAAFSRVHRNGAVNPDAAQGGQPACQSHDRLFHPPRLAICMAHALSQDHFLRMHHALSCFVELFVASSHRHSAIFCRSNRSSEPSSLLKNPLAHGGDSTCRVRWRRACVAGLRIRADVSISRRRPGCLQPSSAGGPGAGLGCLERVTRSLGRLYASEDDPRSLRSNC